MVVTSYLAQHRVSASQHIADNGGHKLLSLTPRASARQHIADNGGHKLLSVIPRASASQHIADNGGHKLSPMPRVSVGQPLVDKQGHDGFLCSICFSMMTTPGLNDDARSVSSLFDPSSNLL
jgi:hypothetical protein